MGPSYDDRKPQEEPTREPLVDLNVKPAQPGDPSAEAKFRRKRLSDLEPEGDEAPPQPQSQPTRQRRRSVTPSGAGPEQPPSESESSPELRRPRLVDIAPVPEQQEPQLKMGRPRGAITPPAQEPPSESESSAEPKRPRLVNTAPAPEDQEPRPKVGRPRATLTQPTEQPPSESESSPEPQRPRLENTPAAPREQESRPKAGRARVAITHSFEDTPGLQNIVDPPHLARDAAGPAPREETAPTSSSVDPVKVEQLVTELRAKQSLSLALAGGLAAAVAGAIVWAVIAVATNYQIGWMAVAVGFLVGGAVRTLGRGIDKSFGCLGATMSVFGCLLGKLLSFFVIVASQEGLSPLAVITQIGSRPIVIPAALLATFHPMDLLFYALAIYEGYRFSFRRVTEADLSRVIARP